MLPFHYNDYSSTATYWANGAVNTLNPLNSSALPTFTYGVDGEGRPNSVSASSGISPIPSANPVTYNVASEVTGVTLGSGDSDSFGFDTNTFRMTNYTVSVGASPNTKTVSGNLTWNANGTLQQLAISDQFNSANTQTCTYLYDDLARLSGNASSPGVNCGASTWQQYFTYDAFGNISKNVPTGGTGTSFQPTYNASTNRYTLSGANVTFDANGNTTQDNAHSYSWDAEGRPVQVDGIGLTYDAFGRMVEQNRSGSYTQILYSPKGDKLALMNGQTVSKAFIPLPAGAAAVYTSGPTLNYFRHPDWLGSVRFASTTSRTMYSDLGYAPFGETYAEAGTPDRSFTGQNQDTVPGPTAGLYDFAFREYAQYGRWVSPDPAGVTAANPSSPQTWNRYAYVGNNPVLGTDPTGLDPSCDLACKQRKLNDDIPFEMNNGFYSGCTFEGMPAPCFVGNSVLTSGAGVACPQNDCSIFQQTFTGNYGRGSYSLVAAANGFVWINNYNGVELNSSAAAEMGLLVPNGQLPANLSVDVPNVAANNGTPPITPVVQRDNGKSIPNVPPEWGFCNKYRDGSGAGSALYDLCMWFPNSPKYNCMRGKLLNQYTPNPNPVQLVWYLLPDHLYDAATCAAGIP